LKLEFFFRSNSSSGAGLPDGLHIFKPKIPIWVISGGPCNGRCLYIKWNFGLFYGHLVYLMAIWYIFGHLVLIFRRFGMLYQEQSGNPALEWRQTVGTILRIQSVDSPFLLFFFMYVRNGSKIYCKNYQIFIATTLVQ
jgi:hypothetical protein